MPRWERSAAQLAERTDGVLAKQALAGDERAFESLVQRYDASLFVRIYRYMGDYDQTCDVLQNVWLQLFRALPTLYTEAPLGPWLFRVARTRCLDALRNRRREYTVSFTELEQEADEQEGSLLAVLPDGHPLPEEIVEHRELQHDLQQAIQALPPKFRRVVLLRYAGHMSFAEIGQVLQMPATTAKTYFRRARLRLAAHLTSQRGSISLLVPDAATVTAVKGVQRFNEP
jgi:RNA polymerase sigma-70 factor (ECF subfamily)